MKKLLIAFGLLLSWAVSFAATTLPVQLLSPTGSASGQSIVSTGASSAPAWGGPAASTLTGVTQYNVAMGGASGLAFVGPGASGGFLISAGPSAYPAFGNTVSSLTATGLITPSGGIAGSANGTSAAAGNVGELQTASASSVALTSGTVANVTSLTLTAGDWNVTGTVVISAASSANPTLHLGGIWTTSGAIGALGTYFQFTTTGFGANSVVGSALPLVPITASTSTIVYCIADTSFSTGSVSASCKLTARRVR